MTAPKAADPFERIEKRAKRIFQNLKAADRGLVFGRVFNEPDTLFTYWYFEGTCLDDAVIKYKSGAALDPEETGYDPDDDERDTVVKMFEGFAGADAPRAIDAYRELYDQVLDAESPQKGYRVDYFGPSKVKFIVALFPDPKHPGAALGVGCAPDAFAPENAIGGPMQWFGGPNG